MLWSILCDYSDGYILVSGTITTTVAGGDDAAKRLDERNKGAIFNNCATFTICKSEINKTQIDHAKHIDVLMPMYNLIEYNNNYLRISGSLWKYNRYDQNNNITKSESFKQKIKITEKTPPVGNTKDVEIASAIKILNKFLENS